MLQIYWVYDNKILNSSPYQMNRIPLIGEEWVWVEVTQGSFNENVYELLKNNLWEITGVRTIGTTSTSIENNIHFIVIKIKDELKNINHFNF